MKKFKIIVPIFVISLLILSIGIYFSPIGANFLKDYLKEKLCLSNKFKINYFNYSLNSFSATLNNQDASVQIFGTLFPVEGSYSANFNNIKILYPLLKGNLNATGEVSNKNNNLNIIGNYLYTKGYGSFKLNCFNHKITGEIKGKNFNTRLLLKNVNGFNFPLFNKIPLDGQNDINVLLNNKDIKIFSNYQGNININGIKVLIRSKFFMNLLNKNNFVFTVDTFSSKLSGKVKGIKNNNDFTLNGILDRFDLELIRKNILYPVVGNIKMKFNYNVDSKLFSFSSNYLNGYSDNKGINFQINMPLKKFFEFLNIPAFLKGNISGNVIINGDKGYFHLLIENASFIPNKTIKKLDRITKVKLENVKSIYFLNGSFDSQKVIFDFISKNLNLYIYLKKGIYYYNGLYSLIFDLKYNKDFYKINLTNNVIKILQHVNSNKPYETLVY